MNIKQTKLNSSLRFRTANFGFFGILILVNNFVKLCFENSLIYGCIYLLSPGLTPSSSEAMKKLLKEIYFFWYSFYFICREPKTKENILKGYLGILLQALLLWSSPSNDLSNYKNWNNGLLIGCLVLSATSVNVGPEFYLTLGLPFLIKLFNFVVYLPIVQSDYYVSTMNFQFHVVQNLVHLICFLIYMNKRTNQAYLLASPLVSLAYYSTSYSFTSNLFSNNKNLEFVFYCFVTSYFLSIVLHLNYYFNNTFTNKTNYSNFLILTLTSLGLLLKLSKLILNPIEEGDFIILWSFRGLFVLILCTLGGLSANIWDQEITRALVEKAKFKNDFKRHNSLRFYCLIMGTNLVKTCWVDDLNLNLFSSTIIKALITFIGAILMQLSSILSYILIK